MEGCILYLLQSGNSFLFYFNVSLFVGRSIQTNLLHHTFMLAVCFSLFCILAERWFFAGSVWMTNCILINTLNVVSYVTKQGSLLNLSDLESELKQQSFMLWSLDKSDYGTLLDTMQVKITFWVHYSWTDVWNVYFLLTCSSVELWYLVSVYCHLQSCDLNMRSLATSKLMLYSNQDHSIS